METPAYKGPNIAICGFCYVGGDATDLMLGLMPLFPWCEVVAASA